MKPIRIIVAVAAVIVALDQWSKHWAVGSLSDGHIVDVISTLRFKLSFNSGMAFSTGSGLGPIIGILAIGVTIGMIIWQLRMVRAGESSRFMLVVTGMIVGGAWGNVVDRLFRGEAWLRGSVVDFIDLQWWPVFNIADAAVTVGVILMFLAAVFARKPEVSDV
jgi:signal peptidase II